MLSRSVATKTLIRSQLGLLPKNAVVAGKTIAGSSLRYLTSSSIEQNNSTNIENDIPWYLREDESSKLDKPIFKEKLPDFPTDSPKSLKSTIDYMINTLGLNDFKIFDIRNRDDLPISTEAQFMVICEGKSEKHIQNASQELVTFLKNHNEVQPYIEGLLKANSLIRMRRRMKRRMINKRNNDRDPEFGVGPNSWVMIDTQVEGVYIHILSHERRKSVNLEYIWCKPEERELYKPSESPNVEIIQDDDSVFASIFKRSYSTERSIDLDDLVIQQLKVGDYDSFDKISSKVRSNVELSTKVLDGIIEDLKNSNVQNIFEDNGELHKSFFDESFPNEPIKRNFEQRFEILSLLHQLIPDEYPINLLIKSIFLQVESGFSINKQDLLKFIQILNKTIKFNNPIEIQNSANLNYNVINKFKQLTRILSIVDINSNEKIFDSEVVLELLRFTTQQSLYSSSSKPQNSTIPYSGDFKVLIRFFEDIKPTNEIIEFILRTYLNSNDIESFYKYWDSISNYEKIGNKLIIDNRPWLLLINLLNEIKSDKFNEIFIHKQLPILLNGEIKLNDDLKEKSLLILNEFDDTGKYYKEIRDELSV